MDELSSTEREKPPSQGLPEHGGKQVGTLAEEDSDGLLTGRVVDIFCQEPAGAREEEATHIGGVRSQQSTSWLYFATCKRAFRVSELLPQQLRRIKD